MKGVYANDGTVILVSDNATPHPPVPIQLKRSKNLQKVLVGRVRDRARRGVRERMDEEETPVEIPLGPGRGFKFAIVGDSSHLGTLRLAAGDRLAAGETVVLPMLIVPEPENEWGERAVAVHAKGFGKVGYFARDDARDWGVVMAGMKIFSGIGTCEGSLRGGTGEKETIGVWLSIKLPAEIESEMKRWSEFRKGNA